MVTFSASGVETYWWLPFLVAFGISSFTSLGGLSGAFLLLPFQVSILGFTSPAVTSTNLLFNIVATPSGVIAFIREKRMVWPLALILSAGTVIGVFLGALLRIRLLPDPRGFKLFVAMVLAYVGIRLVISVFKNPAEGVRNNHESFVVSDIRATIKRIEFKFLDKVHSLSTPVLFALSLGVGIVSAAYGIGGGSIVAPLLVTVFGVPVYAVAGPVFLITFLTSVAGVLAYQVYEWIGITAGLTVSPDWLLGLSFGAGGIAGIYLGSRLQKYVPSRLIKLVIFAAVSFVAIKYVIEFVR